MKTLKVWGGRFIRNGKQGRRIVAAYTKKQAMELAEVSYREITDYWSITGNALELDIAVTPGVWDTSMEFSRVSSDYIRVK